MTLLTSDSPIPLDIQVFDTQGQLTTLREFLGSWFVIFFYPKDDTPGCTIEACSFRDNFPELTNLAIKVIGISKDSPKSHQKFIAKHNLPFTLLSDPEHQLIETFGAWQPKKFMGKEFMGIIRSTFLVDPVGTIRHVWPQVTPQNHAQEVIKVYNMLNINEHS